MPIQFPDFQRLSFDEANPFLVGAERGQKFTQNLLQFPQDLRAKMLANQIAAVQAKYAEPLTQADLEKAKLYNQYYGKDIESQIGLRGAQAGNLGAETRKIDYILNHPGFMGGDETKTIEALRQMGLLGSNYQATTQSTPQSSYQNPQMMGGGFTPIPGNQAAERYAQAQDIANAVVRQQQNMGMTPIQNAPSSNLNIPNFPSYASPSSGYDINGLVQALVNKPMADLKYKQALTQVMQQNVAGKAYTSMPAVEKEYSLAQARGFGYTGEQASKLLNQGYNLSQLAEAKGYDPNDTSSWPIARSAPTTAIQTRIQRANSTLAALDVVQPDISASYSKYSPRFANVSPNLIKDMLSGEKEDDQADALAAYALYPELAALRINAMGGNVGEGAIQHISDAAFSRINTLGLSPSSNVYKKVQERVQKMIRKMNRAENNAIYKQSNEKFDEEDKRSNSDLSNMSDEELMKIAGGQ